MADNLDQLAYLLVDATNRQRQWMDMVMSGSFRSNDQMLDAMKKAHHYGEIAANLRARMIRKVMSDNGYVMVNGRYWENDKL